MHISGYSIVQLKLLALFHHILLYFFMFHKIPFLDLYAKYNSLNCFAFHLTVLCKPGLLQSPWLDIKIIATPTKFCRNAL